MSCILFSNDEECSNKINIDELYENKKKRDLKQISIFNKILNRIHKRIISTKKIKNSNRFIWFNIPEYIFGEQTYDKSECIPYIVTKLLDNGFFVKYIYPSTIFISWENWIPSYVRNEIKKKRGIIVDEKGNIINNDNTELNDDVKINYLDVEYKDNNNTKNIKNIKNENVNSKYKPIDTYKPSGIYGKDIINKFENKIINF